MVERLVKIAIGIAITGTIGLNFANIATQKFHRGNGYCQLPYKVLNDNSKACQLLGGKPIKLMRIDIVESKLKSTEAKLIVPVRGPKRTGLIYTMSTRPNTKSEWTLQYAVMKIREDEKRWNVWLHPDDGIDTNADMLPDDVQVSLL